MGEAPAAEAGDSSGDSEMKELDRSDDDDCDAEDRQSFVSPSTIVQACSVKKKAAVSYGPTNST